MKKQWGSFIASTLFALAGFACASHPLAHRAEPTLRQGLFDRTSSSKKQTKLNRSEKDSVYLRWPLQAVTLTSKFGKRGKRFHEGVDLRAKTGTPVFAAKSGTVIYADRKIRGYGQMVVIRHQADLATVYAHHSKILVKKGDKVEQGQLIALSGNSGRSRGAHLHFEIRRGLSALDPLKLLQVPEIDRRIARIPGARLISVN